MRGEHLAPWANQIEIALVITVGPEFGRQKFMEDRMPKVHWLMVEWALALSISVHSGGNMTVWQRHYEE